MKKLAIIALVAGIVCSQAHAAGTIFDLKSYFTTKYQSAISFFVSRKAQAEVKSTSSKTIPSIQTFENEQETIFGTFVNQKLMPQPDYSHYKRLAYITAGMTGLFLLFSK